MQKKMQKKSIFDVLDKLSVVQLLYLRFDYRIFKNVKYPISGICIFFSHSSICENYPCLTFWINDIEFIY